MKITTLTPSEIKEIRTTFGLTQLKLSKIIGVHPTTISKYELGTYKLTPFPKRFLFHLKIYYIYNKNKIAPKIFAEKLLLRGNDAFIAEILSFTTRL